MMGLIFAFIALVGGIILICMMSKYSEHKVKVDENGRTVFKDGAAVEVVIYPQRKYVPLVAVLMVILIVVFCALGCTRIVHTGHTGVVSTFGKVEDDTLDAGVHFLAPWNKVIEMDNRVQKSQIELECFSSDIQEVTCTYTLNYQISKANAQELYKNVGKDYYDTVITPNVAESVKTIMAHYTAEELVSNRDTLATEIETMLTEQLSKYNIEVVSTALEDLDFTDEFTNAVEAKQVAVQNKLKATTEQEQATMEAEQKAERDVIEAEAQAEVAKIQAQADYEVQKINADTAEYVGLKESAKNEAIAQSLTQELLEYFLIQQWDGQYPTTYMGSEDITAMIGLPTTEE